MKEDFVFLSKIYKDIYIWFATKTPGDIICLSFFKRYDKDVWEKVKNKIIELENKIQLSKIEKEFIKCKYEGNAYRVINYFSRRKGHVFKANTYQSCSKDIDSVKKISIHGDKILMELKASKEMYAIDLMMLLRFMIKNELINIEDMKFYSFFNLEKYIDEKEVIVPISDKSIVNISVVNFEKGTYTEIPQNQWFRNTL